MHVTGYRRDVYENFGSLYMDDEQMASRVFAVTSGSGTFDAQQGRMRSTEQSTDMAIDGQGFFVSERDGMAPSLTRRGDMSVSLEGVLVNGAGARMLDDGLQPIQVPPFRKLIVAEDGKLLY